MKILFIDDDEDILYLLQRSYAKKFYVWTAENCQTALKKMQLVQFDVIVSDWNLPDGNGALNYLYASECHQKAKFIIFSDSDRARLVAVSDAMPSVQFIGKDLHGLQNLSNAIEGVVNER